MRIAPKIGRTYLVRKDFILHQIVAEISPYATIMARGCTVLGIIKLGTMIAVCMPINLHSFIAFRYITF